MKALIFSDSHNDTTHMFATLEKIGKDMDIVLHLGDGYHDLNATKHLYPNLVFHNVAGNCDGNIQQPSFLVLTLHGKRVLMTHGHHFNVRDGLNNLQTLAQKEQAHIALFGHTHHPLITTIANQIFMNPGSISRPKAQPFPSYGVMEITDDGQIHTSVVSVEPNQNRVIL